MKTAKPYELSKEDYENALKERDRIIKWYFAKLEDANMRLKIMECKKCDQCGKPVFDEIHFKDNKLNAIYCLECGIKTDAFKVVQLKAKKDIEDWYMSIQGVNKN